ncbi:SurA N-terminal domain-containing protein [Taklimakanibacter lacteus]|uniref:SurA N-terminal domain-containing protein n=1 Tax=Taklimakanibacter lacteus TaxID=2268456 RepID=UPI000E672E26
MKTGVFLAAAFAASLLSHASIGHAAGESGQGVLVTVNDYPITSFDVDQRMKLNAVLGRAQGSAADQRKRALQALIDDVVKVVEAKKYKADPNDKTIDAQIEKMAKGSKTDTKGLAAQLKSKGVSMTTLRRLVTAQISFNRLLAGMYKLKVEVDPAEVDKKYNEIVNDPRLKPVSVYEILEIDMPVDSATSDAMGQQLFVARAADAAQYRQKFKGCNSARQAASGIYNVRIGKRLQADGAKIPKPLRAALDQAGPGGIVGPARSKTGIQLIAFCGRKSIAPEKPTRDQIETMLTNKKYDVYEERYMRELRRNAFIEYKDAKATEGAKATE